mmetsp:Transcript_13752/g.27445  ORF Transcript_13752/g.27445 Transcript_13752/m.27445 type:complete len:312 (-) Transcript_13752:413-1348(-)
MKVVPLRRGGSQPQKNSHVVRCRKRPETKQTKQSHREIEPQSDSDDERTDVVEDWRSPFNKLFGKKCRKQRDAGRTEERSRGVDRPEPSTLIGEKSTSVADVALRKVRSLLPSKKSHRPVSPVPAGIVPDACGIDDSMADTELRRVKSLSPLRGRYVPGGFNFAVQKLQIMKEQEINRRELESYKKNVHAAYMDGREQEINRMELESYESIHATYMDGRDENIDEDINHMVQHAVSQILVGPGADVDDTEIRREQEIKKKERKLFRKKMHASLSSAIGRRPKNTDEAVPSPNVLSLPPSMREHYTRFSGSF